MWISVSVEISFILELLNAKDTFLIKDRSMVKNTNLLAQTDHCQFFMYLSQQTFKIKINQT